jgi:hypothetical protein
VTRAGVTRAGLTRTGLTRTGVTRADAAQRSPRDDPGMANPVPSGSDVSAGTYRCTNCGYELQVGSTKNLPPCPSCNNGHWNTESGGDAGSDPYPSS